MIALKVEHKEIKNMEFGRIRVYSQRGTTPVIFIAPHGVDDKNTDEIAKAAADYLDAYAVINQGFKRSQVVDVLSDKADCNRIDHVTQDVVKEEFLDSIIRFKGEIDRAAAIEMTRNIPKAISIEEFKLPIRPLIVIIHGVGSKIHKTAGEAISCVVGYGQGKYDDSIICEEWRKNLFVEVFKYYFTQGEIYVGKGGGKYAARKKNNMAQYFRLYKKDINVDCLQLEFPLFLRKNKWESTITGNNLASAVRDVLLCDSYESDIEIKEI